MLLLSHHAPSEQWIFRRLGNLVSHQCRFGSIKRAELTFVVALHEYIQKAFGWWNCHLHQFQIDGELYSLPATGNFDLGDEHLDETQVLLSQLIPKSGERARWNYEYDFDDGWRHEVLFEGHASSEN